MTPIVLNIHHKHNKTKSSTSKTGREEFVNNDEKHAAYNMYHLHKHVTGIKYLLADKLIF